MSRDPEIYEKIKDSITPSIYGYDDVKRLWACSWYRGSRASPGRSASEETFTSCWWAIRHRKSQLLSIW